MKVPVRIRRIAAPRTFFALLALVVLAALLGLGYRDVRQGALDRALFVAVRRHPIERVRGLLDAGADPNTMLSRDASTSLGDWTAFIRERALLLWHGGASGAVPDSRTTVLGMAAARGELPLIRLLVERGADVNRVDPFRDYATPLVTAAGQHGAVRVLLDHGANVNARSRNGQTVLTNAIRLGSVPVVRLLLERGADVNRRDARGKTALALAADHQSPAIVALLKQRGATR